MNAHSQITSEKLALFHAQLEKNKSLALRKSMGLSHSTAIFQ
ncbi:MAG: hypothetical protein US32_C0021G0015 [candidate division TM6 bacterium GW2011_GWA2_36_9]|nr:MAG: hypothetical protein US32_C0021G0015 [candidate division TM6 bacterium GW2011_GWA2_36_9]